MPADRSDTVRWPVNAARVPAARPPAKPPAVEPPASGAHRPRARLVGYAALAGSVVGIGAAVVFIRLSEVDATATLMLRMVVASAILSATVLPRRRPAGPRPPASRRDLALLALASVLAGVDLLANNWAVNLTSIASAVLLSNLTPVFVLLIAFLAGRPATRWQVAAVGLAVAGAALLMSADGSVSAAPGVRLLGDGLSLLSAAVYAVYIMLTKGLAERLPTILIMFANSLVTAALLAPVAMATSQQVLPRTPAGYAVILGYAVVSQLIGHGLLTLALRTVDATLASVSVLLRPVVSVLLGWVILGEALRGGQLLGGAVVLAALAWFELGRAPDGPHPTGDPVVAAPPGTRAGGAQP